MCPACRSESLIYRGYYYLGVKKPLRLLLLLANSSAVAVLLAIPVGKLFGFIEQEVDAAAVNGWFLFFVPFLTSAMAIAGIHFSRSELAQPTVMVAMPGSFLIALLSLYIVMAGPPAFTVIGLGAAIILSLNVVMLWQPFLERIK